MIDYHVPLQNRIARRTLQPVLRSIFRLISRIKVEGLENIPQDPYIVVFNHVSLYEAPMILAHWPSCPEILGASDVWKKPGQNILAWLYGGIPIHRGVIDRTALHAAVAAVRSGRSLILSPEGTRSHQPGMQMAKSGLTYIFDKTGAWILPVGIVGSTPDFLSNALKGRKPEASVIIGKPFKMPALDESGKANAVIRQQKVDYVMKQIADLLPEEYRGYYA